MIQNSGLAGGEFGVKMGTTVRQIYIGAWVLIFVDHKIFNGIILFI